MTTRTTPEQDGDTLMQDLVKTHVRNILNGLAHQNSRTAEKIKEIWGAGGRIIIPRQREEGHAGPAWEIVDWYTGAVLATSRQHRTQSEAINAIPGERWTVELVWESIDRSGPKPPDGLPASLADMLEDWVDSPHTTDADIAAVADVDPEEVEGCRRDPLYDWVPALSPHAEGA